MVSIATMANKMTSIHTQFVKNVIRTHILLVK